MSVESGEVKMEDMNSPSLPTVLVEREKRPASISSPTPSLRRYEKRARRDPEDPRESQFEEWRNRGSGSSGTPGRGESIFASNHPGRVSSGKDLLVNVLLNSQPDTALYRRSVEDVVDMCHTPLPGEAALQEIVDLCKVKGATHKQISGVLSDLRPAWRQKVGKYLASLIMTPEHLRDMIESLTHEVEVQHSLVIPSYSMQVLKQTLDSLCAPLDTTKLASVIGRTSLNSPAPTGTQYPGLTTTQGPRISEPISRNRKHEEPKRRQEFAADGRVPLRDRLEAMLRPAIMQPAPPEKGLPRMSTSSSTHINGANMQPRSSPVSSIHSGPRRQRDPSTMAMIHPVNPYPSCLGKRILSDCRKTLGDKGGLGRVEVTAGNGPWILCFDTIMDAEKAIGTAVKVFEEVVTIKPYPRLGIEVARAKPRRQAVNSIKLPCALSKARASTEMVFRSAGSSRSTKMAASIDGRSEPDIYMIVFQNGPLKVRQDKLISDLSMRFPYTGFSVQAQLQPIFGKHVKWILAFDGMLSARASNFRLLLTLSEPDEMGSLQVSVTASPVVDTAHCVVCRDNHKHTQCRHLYALQLPDGVQIPRYHVRVD